MTRETHNSAALIDLALKAQKATYRDAGQEPDPRASLIWAEYEAAVTREHDRTALAQLLLPGNRDRLTPDTLVPVLCKLAQLYSDSIGVKLALADGLYFAGKDDEALDVLSRLKLTAPYDIDLLHAELSFSFVADDDTRRLLCEEVLRIYPSDQVALAVLRDLDSGKRSEVFDVRKLYDRALEEIQSSGDWH